MLPSLVDVLLQVGDSYCVYHNTDSVLLVSDTTFGIVLPKGDVGFLYTISTKI